MLEATRDAFLDELRKIADVSLSGLSPETILSTPNPEPMQTSGYDKAMSILNKAQSIKTAGVYRASKKADDDPYVKHIRPTGAAGLKGMGTGMTLAALHSSTKGRFLSPKKALVGAGVGMAGGVADHLYTGRAIKKGQGKTKTSAFTPGMALKASRQVGAVRSSTKATPGLKKFVPRIGTKGSLP